MPTGYTAEVQSGEITDLKDYAASCARAFGAFMHQRDDSTDAALKYPQPDFDYYESSLKDSIKEQARWSNLSEEEKYAEWSEYYNDALVSRAEAIAKNNEVRARYNRMLSQVEAVQVSSNLQSFKDFMIDQLKSSIGFDCGEDDSFTIKYYTPLEYVQWCDKKKDTADWNVEYYSKELLKAETRYKESVKFIDNMAATFGFEVQK